MALNLLFGCHIDATEQKRALNFELVVSNQLFFVILVAYNYRTCAILTRSLYTFYTLFEVHICTLTFGIIYVKYSRAVSIPERVIVARVR